MTSITGHTTRAAGTVLTASIYNTDHVNHVNNANALNTGKMEQVSGATNIGRLARFVDTSSGLGESVGIWESADGKIGIGTLSPGTVFEIQGSDADTVKAKLTNTSSTSARYPGWEVYNYGGSTGGHPISAQYNARGSSATPGALQSGDMVGTHTWYGYDGTAFQQGARISILAANTWSGAGHPTHMTFSISGDTGAYAEKMRLTKDGSFVIGGTSADADAIFQVDSTTKGVLIPRMTTTQRQAITTPPDGLMVYDTDLHVLCFYDTVAIEWKKVTVTTA